jgi:surface carbohydrate biosynthesis protein
MSKKIILLPIESFSRDSLSRVYLANKLCENNSEIKVIIGHPEILLNVFLPAIKNAIWLGRFISLTGDTKADDKLNTILKKHNCKMFFLHDEGAFYADDNYDEALKMLHCPKLLNKEHVKYVLVWGEYQKKYLGRLIDPRKILVSGMYRFDLLKLDNSHFKNTKSKYGKEYTLINTRFPESNLLKGEIGIFEKRTLQHYLSSQYTKEHALEDMFKVWSVINESFSAFVYAVFKLVSINKETLFVIRPHPVESLKFYQEAFGFFENVIIDNEVDICEHIRYSNLVIHNQCTTGVESIISGKPTINFIPTQRKNIVGTSNSGLIVSNYEELLINYSLFKMNNFQSYLKESNEYLRNVDASFMTSDYLIDILRNEQMESTISYFNLFLNWNLDKTKTVIKFSIIIPVLRFFNSKNKQTQYSINVLKEYSKSKFKRGIHFNSIYSCILSKKR